MLNGKTFLGKGIAFGRIYRDRCRYVGPYGLAGLVTEERPIINRLKGKIKEMGLSSGWSRYSRL